jgi:hypothetical protein
MAKHESQRAKQAIAGLFAPLQDIDVYVEDHNDEPFYSELLRRIATKGFRVVRVFAVGNRNTVIDRGKAHNHGQRRALFLIDGDFEWVLDRPAPTVRALHRLDAYCIENLIATEAALIQIVMEDRAVDEDEARRCLGFSTWLNSISKPLLDLFVVFAVVHELDPTKATVSRGIGEILVQSRKHHPPVVDAGKVATVTQSLLSDLIMKCGQAKVDEVTTTVLSRINGLARPLDVVSGKDYIIPLLEFHLRECAGTKCGRRSLRFRMARHASLTRFAELTRALDAAARGLLERISI